MVELLIVIGVIGIAMALVATLTLAGVKAWQKQWTRVKLERQAQSFMYTLTYNLRQAQPGPIQISNNTGELNNSLITFTPVGQSLPVSFYLKTLTTSGGKVLSKQAIFSQGVTTSAPSTVFSQNVMATDVMSLYFTFPSYADTSRVMVNISLFKTPLAGTAPVYFQAQETVYVRN